MHEHLELDVGGGADGRQLGERQLARHHDARGTEARGQRDRRRVGAGHLRRGVQRQLGSHGPCQAHHPQILHDDRVDAGGGRGADGALDLAELVIEHQRVERQVALDAGLVQHAEHARQLTEREVGGARARVEGLHAEVHRVGPGSHRGVQTLLVAGGGEHLGAHGRSVADGARRSMACRRTVAKPRPPSGARPLPLSCEAG
ncbi:MAG: hypothetical protein A2138_26285 [Deltaproteobacteria bacterium RBG_16_71_12]|nr:MAG: hypothetical protein A2138_26285 [Deltaproteobacteria bacterium RBG_16_71_12]